MLVELLIENYAVVERLRVRFHQGLNALTGETGSGKSIVVDALGLLFGGRASAEMVRSGAERARVSGIFEVPQDAGFQAVLDQAGLELEENEILIEREILASGKSRAFAASRPVTAAVLRDLAPFLGDIHGQHDQQQLFSYEAQRDMLDAFSGSGAAVSEVASIYRDWRKTGAELAELDRTEQEKLRLLDLWTFQRKEIEAAHLQPGEDAALENERRVLQNVTKLVENANFAYDTLYDAEESVHRQLRIAMKRLDELTRIDDSLSEVVETLRPAQVAIEDASRTLSDYLARREADPERLEAVESRLAALDKLKRKYGGSIEEILAFLQQVTQQIQAVETAGERRAGLQKDQSRLEERYRAVSTRLTAQRQECGKRLAKKVEGELKTLAMERSTFQVAVQPAPWSPAGADEVCYLFSANLGEEAKPLDKVASGGELSRVALALKSVLATTDSRKKTSIPRTLVFDEVDAGIGGHAAEMVGRRLKNIASGNQVLCVTHLPQIAGFADHHYVVAKHAERNRTVTTIAELSGEDRTREIGRMLSGQNLTPEALRYAEQLIRAGAG